MATKLMQARQHELKFLSHQKKGGACGGEDGETCTDQDDGSIARSSLDLSQEFREAAQGCFSATLKRNFKAFCGRLGKWSVGNKKSSSLYKYLHINVPPSHHDPHLHPLAFHKQKSKSRQSLLDRPIGLQEHAYITTHEEIKDIHLDPQGSSTFNIHGIKSQAQVTPLDLHEDTKPQDQHPLIPSLSYGGDRQDLPYKSSRGVDNLEKKHGTHLTLGAKPSLIEGFEQQGQQLVLASHEGSRRQMEVLTAGINQLMLGVTHSLGRQVTPFLSSNDDTSPSLRSLQVKIPKPKLVHLTKPKPFLNLEGSDSLLSAHGHEIIRSTFDTNYTHNKVHDVDDYLSSLATHVFSLRNQVAKGGFGGVLYASLQGREAKRQHDINFNNRYNNNDADDVKKSMAGLISGRKFEDLADLEEFLQCYMRLYSPCFLDMVNQFFREICNDIFECESWFDHKDPLIHTFA